MERCLLRLRRLHRTASVHPEDRGEYILSHLYTDKFVPMTCFTNSPTQVSKVKDMFKAVPDNDLIKGLARKVVLEVAPELERHAMEAFVSSIPTEENLYALLDKFNRTSARWNADPILFKATLSILAHRMEVHKYQMIPTIDPEVAGTLAFNPNAGTGFLHWNIPIAKNKRNFGPYADEALRRILTAMPDYIGHSEDLIPPVS